MGALQLTLFLRRRGHEALYLGLNIPTNNLVEGVRDLQSRLLCLSTNTEDAVGGLVEVAEAVANLRGYRPSLAFSGDIFSRKPELHSVVAGLYLGKTGSEAVHRIESLLQGRS